MKLQEATLIFLEGFTGITAAVGGIALIYTDGLGMPNAWLSASPFNSYFVPGLILFFAVGLVNIAAAALTLRRHTYAGEVSVIGGFSLLIWIFIETYIVNANHWLQMFYFAVGILALIFTMSTERAKWQKNRF